MVAHTSDSNEGRLCVGLISGTSADGIDAALVRISGAGAGARVDLLGFASTPYPDDVRQELLALYADDARQAVARLCSLNVVVGELFASAALDVCRQSGVAPETVSVIGSHGQTVWHQPESDPSLPLSILSTLQIGEPAVIAERTGITVVADFRAGDIAAGGQAAPLVTYFDWVVLRDPHRHRAVQNIGGIGNVTSLPARGGLDTVRAFDTGPGNMLIDGLVTLLTDGAASFDQDGALATSGQVDLDLLEALIRDDDYLRQPPPKTTGRERYGAPFVQNIARRSGVAMGVLNPATTASQEAQQRARDVVATVTAYTAHSIADAYRRWLPGIDEVLVGGGGSRNPVLMDMLRTELAPIPVAPVEDYGINSRAKEAMAFALMAHDGLEGLPTNVPSATGARRTVALGKVCPPGSRQ